jgi:hypothetical protein
MSKATASQAGLSSWSALELVEAPKRDSISEPVRCPDCHQPISESKGGQPLPDDLDSGLERTFGWRCDDCHNVIPSRAFNAEASSFNDHMSGFELTFRGGHSRFVPVPTAHRECAQDGDRS